MDVNKLLAEARAEEGSAAEQGSDAEAPVEALPPKSAGAWKPKRRSLQTKAPAISFG